MPMNFHPLTRWANPFVVCLCHYDDVEEVRFSGHLTDIFPVTNVAMPHRLQHRPPWDEVGKLFCQPVRGLNCDDQRSALRSRIGAQNVMKHVHALGYGPVLIVAISVCQVLVQVDCQTWPYGASVNPCIFSGSVLISLRCPSKIGMRG